MKLSRPHWTLRHRLLLIAVAGVLPVAMMAGLGLWLLASGHAREAQLKSQEITRVAAAAIDLELQRSITALNGLSVSPMLDRGDVATFQMLLERFVSRMPGWHSALLHAADGHVLAHSYGADPWIVMPELVSQAAATAREGAPRVGWLLQAGPERAAVPVSTPVLREGEHRYVLTALLKPDAFADILRAQRLPAAWTVSVFDRRGLRVARSHAHRIHLGTAAAPLLQDLMALNLPSGTGISRTLEGVEVHTAYVRLPGSQWVVALGIPTADTAKDVVGALAAYGAGIAGSVLLAFVAAALAARGITAPIDQLRRAAGQIGRGQPMQPPDTTVRELIELGSAMSSAAQDLRRLEDERGRVVTQLRDARDELGERVTELEQLNRMMQQLVLQQDLDAQLLTVLAAQCSFHRSSKALLTLFDEATQRLQVRASCGLAPETLAELQRGVPGNSICARTLTEGRHVVVEDMRTEGDFAVFRELAEREGVRAVHSMPIRAASSRLLGVISIYRERPGPPDPRALHLAELCTRLAAVVIERSLAEAEAVESSRRLRVALDSSTVPFSIMAPLRDATGVITDFSWYYLNRAAAIDARHPVEALQGQRVSRMAPHLWRIPDLFDAYVSVAVRATPRELEVRADQGDAERWLHVVAAPFDDKVAVWSADITQRVRQEQALQVADRRKDEFLAILAHELRNPLAPIQHAAVIASMAGATEAQQRWSREVIERQVRQMAMLLDDLLDVSRITRGKLELRRSNIQLQAAIEAGVETARPHIDAGEHTLTVTIAEPGIALLADPLRLAQVVTNLLVNAARYTPRGGRIELTAAIDSRGDVRVEVRDNGSGVPSTDLDLIFEMFAQGSQRRAHGGGLGIGLALSRGIARLHGGDLRAHSDGPGKGSCFVLTLPAAATPPEDGSKKIPVLPAAHRHLRVIIVDDNRDAADTLEALMRLSGHHVRVAYDGSAAVEHYRAEPADLILLDIGMPGMSGYEVARRIRSFQPPGQAPLIVAMSGWGQAQDKRSAIEAGIDRHLTKPVEPQALIQLIAAHYPSTMDADTGATPDEATAPADV